MKYTPEGRLYCDYRWELIDYDCWHPRFPQDYEWMFAEYWVPNGKWVLDSREIDNGRSQLVGITSDEMHLESLTAENGTEYTLYVSNKPFGFVAEDGMSRAAAPLGFIPPSQKRLVYSRQIHKGELGYSVPIPRLEYVRQPFQGGEKPNVTKAHQRRRGYGWVQLCDLGEMTVGYNPDKQIELILGYWQFSGHLRYKDNQRIGTLVDTIWGSRFDIESGDCEVVSMAQSQFLEAFAGDSSDTSELWVRRGFAFTILRLMALGVKPAVIQPV